MKSRWGGSTSASSELCHFSFEPSSSFSLPSPPAEECVEENGLSFSAVGWPLNRSPPLACKCQVKVYCMAQEVKTALAINT